MTSNAQPLRPVHATGRQGWAVLVGLLALSVGGIVLYLARLWDSV